MAATHMRERNQPQTDDASGKIMQKNESGTKRYNLVLPTELFTEIQSLAKKQNVSILELIRRLLKIGLVVVKVIQSPDASLIIRQGDRERELVLL